MERHKFSLRTSPTSGGASPVYFSFLLGWIPPRSERPLAFTHHLLAAPTFAETLRFSLFDVFFAYS
ncbi:MAG: hypothetical protein ACXWJJ_10380, partial [Ramlibacter sp.]